jgi:cellulose synthase/poly-beta-1,6-N-acetylglucosamine synthase-like glycosyltransferase
MFGLKARVLCMQNGVSPQWRPPCSGHRLLGIMQKRGLLAESAAPTLIRQKKPKLPGSATERPQTTPSRIISIVIPAHNEERYLEKTLEALSRQEYGWFEVIVVANGCTDQTVEVARGRCHRLIVLSQKNLGLARNLGAKMARSELLVFLDADTLLEPDALRTIAQEFSNKYAAGTLKGQPDCSCLKYRLCTCSKILYIGRASMAAVPG